MNAGPGLFQEVEINYFPKWRLSHCPAARAVLARRLAGILYAMWRDQRDYDATLLRRRPRRAAGSSLPHPVH